MGRIYWCGWDLNPFHWSKNTLTAIVPLKDLFSHQRKLLLHLCEIAPVEVSRMHILKYKGH